MSNLAVILSNSNEVISVVDTELPSGTTVYYAYDRTIEGALVGARRGRISRTKRYLNSRDAMVTDAPLYWREGV